MIINQPIFRNKHKILQFLGKLEVAIKLIYLFVGKDSTAGQNPKELIFG